MEPYFGWASLDAIMLALLRAAALRTILEYSPCVLPRR
jgi:hypothetical protein